MYQVKKRTDVMKKAPNFNQRLTKLNEELVNTIKELVVGTEEKEIFFPLENEDEGIDWDDQLVLLYEDEGGASNVVAKSIHFDYHGNLVLDIFGDFGNPDDCTTISVYELGIEQLCCVYEYVCRERGVEIEDTK